MMTGAAHSLPDHDKMKMWMVFDASGQAVVEKDMDKAVMIQQLGIHARDLRLLDPKLSYPSTILGRERAIVLNLEHIKVIITMEEVLLRNPTQPDVVPIVEELQRRLLPAFKEQGTPALERKDSRRSSRKSDSDGEGDFLAAPPFEFRALDVALEAICSFLDARTTELEASAYPSVDELTSKMSHRKLDGVRKLKSRMTRLTARVQKVRDELVQLLEDDDDMAELYLTRKRARSGATASPGPGSVMTRTKSLTTTHRAVDDVEEVEMLLECYVMQIDETLNKLSALREYIGDTEDYINIHLDNHRNRLIQLELVLNAAVLSMALYSLVAGFFGMNLPYSWNEGHPSMFQWVVLFGAILASLLFSAVWAYARSRRLLGTCL